MGLLTSFSDLGWADRLGLTLFHSLWQIVAIAALHAVIILLLRKRSANARYCMGCVAMTAMLAVPMGTYLVTSPVQPVGITDSTMLLLEHNDPQMEDVSVDLLPTASDVDAEFPVLIVPSEAWPEATPPVPAVEPEELSTLLESLPVSEAPPLVEEPLQEPEGARIKSIVRSCLPWTTGFWILGVTILSLRPLWGWMHVRGLQRRGLSPLPQALQEACVSVKQRLGVRFAVRFMQSTLVHVPTVVGFLRPMVLLPASVVAEMSMDEIEMILAHELAHIRRHDWLVNLTQLVIETLLFYHPAMWWVSRQIRKERENCCDDVAVAMNGNRAAYARALARLEEHRGTVAALSAGGGSLLDRIRRLLGRSAPETRCYNVTVWAAGLASLLIVAAVIIGGYAGARGTAATPSVEEELESSSGDPLTLNDIVSQHMDHWRRFDEADRAVRFDIDHTTPDDEIGMKMTGEWSVSNGKQRLVEYRFKNDFHEGRTLPRIEDQLYDGENLWQIEVDPDSHGMDRISLFSRLTGSDNDKYILKRNNKNYIPVVPYFLRYFSFGSGPRTNLEECLARFEGEATLVGQSLNEDGDTLWTVRFRTSGSSMVGMRRYPGGAIEQQTVDEEQEDILRFNADKGFLVEEHLVDYALGEPIPQGSRWSFSVSEYIQDDDGLWLPAEIWYETSVVDKNGEEDLTCSGPSVLRYDEPLGYGGVDNYPDFPENAICTEWFADSGESLYHVMGKDNAYQATFEDRGDARRHIGILNVLMPLDVSEEDTEEAEGNTRSSIGENEYVYSLARNYIANRDSFTQVECGYEIGKYWPSFEEPVQEGLARNIRNIAYNTVFEDIVSESTIGPRARCQGLLIQDGSLLRVENNVSEEERQRAIDERLGVFSTNRFWQDGESVVRNSGRTNSWIVYDPEMTPDVNVYAPFRFGHSDQSETWRFPSAIIEHPELNQQVRLLDEPAPSAPDMAVPSSELIGVEYAWEISSETETHTLTSQHWFAPTAGHLPIITKHYMDGELFEKITITDVRHVGENRAYPIRSICFHYDSQEERITFALETLITDLTVDEPIDESRLKVELPEPTMLHYTTLNASTGTPSYKSRLSDSGLHSVAELYALFGETEEPPAPASVEELERNARTAALMEEQLARLQFEGIEYEARSYPWPRSCDGETLDESIALLNEPEQYLPPSVPGNGGIKTNFHANTFWRVRRVQKVLGEIAELEQDEARVKCQEIFDLTFARYEEVLDQSLLRYEIPGCPRNTVSVFAHQQSVCATILCFAEIEDYESMNEAIVQMEAHLSEIEERILSNESVYPESFWMLIQRNIRPDEHFILNALLYASRNDPDLEWEEFIEELGVVPVAYRIPTSPWLSQTGYRDITNRIDVGPLNADRYEEYIVAYDWPSEAMFDGAKQRDIVRRLKAMIDGVESPASGSSEIPIEAQERSEKIRRELLEFSRMGPGPDTDQTLDVIAEYGDDVVLEIECLSEEQVLDSSGQQQMLFLLEAVNSEKSRTLLLRYALGSLGVDSSFMHSAAGLKLLACDPEAAWLLLESPSRQVVEESLVSLVGRQVDAEQLELLIRVFDRENPTLNLITTTLLVKGCSDELADQALDSIIDSLEAIPNRFDQDPELETALFLGYSLHVISQMLPNIKVDDEQLRQHAEQLEGRTQDIVYIALASRGDQSVHDEIIAIIMNQEARSRRALAVNSLRIIGQIEDIPLLEELQTNDPFTEGAVLRTEFGLKHNINTYPVRNAARYTISVIEQKIKEESSEQEYFEAVIQLGESDQVEEPISQRQQAIKTLVDEMAVESLTETSAHLNLASGFSTIHCGILDEQLLAANALANRRLNRLYEAMDDMPPEEARRLCRETFDLMLTDHKEYKGMYFQLVGDPVLDGFQRHEHRFDSLKGLCSALILTAYFGGPEMLLEQLGETDLAARKMWNEWSNSPLALQESGLFTEQRMEPDSQFRIAVLTLAIERGEATDAETLESIHQRLADLSKIRYQLVQWSELVSGWDTFGPAENVEPSVVIANPELYNTVYVAEAERRQIIAFLRSIISGEVEPAVPRIEVPPHQGPLHAEEEPPLIPPFFEGTGLMDADPATFPAATSPPAAVESRPLRD
jgi:beta-lactamase regulating signal transducer with metallopeptidase domain